MPELLSINNTVAQSADFTIAAGEVKGIGITSATPPLTPNCQVLLMQKHGDDYYVRARFDEKMSSGSLDIPGTWALKRIHGTVGAFVD